MRARRKEQEGSGGGPIQYPSPLSNLRQERLRQKPALEKQDDEEAHQKGPSHPAFRSRLRRLKMLRRELKFFEQLFLVCGDHDGQLSSLELVQMNPS